MRKTLIRGTAFLALPAVLLGRGDFDQRLDRALQGQGHAALGEEPSPKPLAAAAHGSHGAAHGTAHGTVPELSPWERLAQGNARFAAGQVLRPRGGPKRRGEVAQQQQPFAVVLACADSRVAPELLFDQGLGDLFVVRVAGNVAGAFDRASVEYAVEHLHSSLVLVLGHERCGAVKASLGVAQDPKAGEGLSPDLKALVKEIEPAVQGRGGEQALDEGVRENARRSARRLLEQSPALQSAVKAGHLQVISARYDLDSGKVERLD